MTVRELIAILRELDGGTRIVVLDHERGGIACTPEVLPWMDYAVCIELGEAEESEAKVIGTLGPWRADS
jgi:hypothetical protein